MPLFPVSEPLGEVMKMRHGLAVSSLAGSLLIMGGAPASAAPPLPPGCTFDAGVQTCSVATTSAPTTVGPITSAGEVPASTTFAGFTGVQICEGVTGIPQDAVRVQFDDLFFTESVVTTTTTKRHGLNGKVFSTVTTSKAMVGSYVSGVFVCFYI
jgi:hypothetical protein